MGFFRFNSKVKRNTQLVPTEMVEMNGTLALYNIGWLNKMAYISRLCILDDVI